MTIADEGGYVKMEFTDNEFVRVITDEPTLVTAFPKSNTLTDENPPSMIITPPRAQWMSSYTFVLPDDRSDILTFENFLFVVIERGTNSALMINGNPVDTTNWADIVDSTLQGKHIPLGTGFHQVSHTDVSPMFSS